MVFKAVGKMCLGYNGEHGKYGCFQNRGTPKWMVKIMENPLKMDDFGGTIIFGNTHMAAAIQGYPNLGGWRFITQIYVCFRFSHPAN